MRFVQAKPHPIPLGPDSVEKANPNTLFNGWKLTPAGRNVGVNSLPLKLLLSPDGRTLVAVCSGRWNGIALVDLKTEETRQWVPLDRTFNGAAFSKDGKKLFVTGGNSDALYVFNFDGQKVDKPKTFHLDAAASPARKDNDFLAGMIVDSKSGKLYICNEGSSDILVVDPDSGKVEDKWKAQSHPYTFALGIDGRYLYVSNWGDKSVSALDMESGEEAVHIAVGIRPNEMAVAPDGRLFVTCAGDNTVHVIQTQAPQDTDRDAHTDAKTPPPPMPWRSSRPAFIHHPRRIDSRCGRGFPRWQEPVRRQRG